MKIGIRKYLSGGGIAPFTYYTPVTVNDAPTASTTADTTTKSASSSNSGEITDKDLLSMLKEIDGLPSDMNQIFNSITSLYKLSSLSGVSSDTINTRYVRILQGVKNAKFNKALYDSAKKELISNGGLNEVAIDNDGKIVVKDSKGKILRMSLESFNNSKGKYTALSNQELLDTRAYSAPMDNSIFGIVSNGVGMEAVNKYINNIIQNLGNSENTLEGYTRLGTSNGKLLLQGFGLLLELANSGLDLTGGLDGLFKSKVITELLKNQATKALKYLFATMPDNMKTLLEFKAGSKEGALELILDIVLSKNKDKKNITIDYKLDASGKTPGGKGSGSSEGGSGLEDQKTNLYSNIITGTGGSASSYQIKDQNGNTMTVNGQAYPNLSLNPSNQITEGSISDLMLSFNAISRGGKYAITFGSQVLNSSDMDNMTFLNDGRAIRTYLPVKDDGLGHIVPDLQFMEEHKDLINLINSKNNNMLDPEVLKKLKESGIINEFTGEIDTNKFAPYLLVNGLGTSRNVKDTSFVTEVTGDNLDQMIDKFENDLYIKKGKDGDDQGTAHKFNFDRESIINPLDWFGNYDKLYQGTIFIPITLNINQGLQGGGTELKMGELDIMELDYNNFLTQSSMNNTSSNLLGI